MTEWEALMRAVCEHPDDDTPRLVLADWLDENGEPERAKFIRAQCQLLRVPSRDPEWEVLHKRQDRLLNLYSRRWASELPYRYVYRWAEGYVRGFRCGLTVSDEAAFLRDVDEVFEAAPVTALTVHGPLAWEKLAPAGYLDRFRHISIGSHNLGLIVTDLCALGRFPRLTLTVGASFTNLGVHRISPKTEAALKAAFGDRLRLPPDGVWG